ncbi:MAG: hypothetical protein M4579_006002 [Chaenotheca gracillima]|nr:MAG: hypothetical protein M4579_006002 [Chaenotheca gracillima]
MANNDFYREFYSSSRLPKPSLKELVNRFDAKEDGSSPVLPTPGQRSASGGSSPSTAGTRLPKRPPANVGAAAPHPRSVSSVSMSDMRKPIPQISNPPQKRKLAAANASVGGPTSPSSKGERSNTAMANNPWASQSMTSLHLAHNEAAQRPLFGEVVRAGGDSRYPGFGIHDPRATSEALDVPTTNGHRRSRSDLELPPSSPTAWYLGLTTSPPNAPAADADKRERSSARRLHRRTRSDFAGVPALSIDTNQYPPEAFPPFLQELSPKMNLNTNTKAPSRSRIPQSTRRQSATSDSGASLHSSRSSSAMGGMITSPRGAPQKGQSGIPRRKQHPNPVSSPPRTPSRPHSRRQDLTLDHSSGPSASLRAYISTPVPEKSPPLRSSRPRLPVSSASTSSSRAKAVDRYGTQPNRSSRRTDPNQRDAKARPRNIPELGGVDFAARREKIQRAFTKSVREKEANDKMEADAEARHARRAKEATATPPPSSEDMRAEKQIDPLDTSSPVQSGTEDHVPHHPEPSEEPAATVEGPVETELRRPPSLDRAALTNGDHAESSAEVTDFGQDSPTLGIPGSFPEYQPTSPSLDLPLRIHTPVSAVTQIDNEPQVDNRSSSPIEPPSNSRTVLSQVMQLRDSSPTSTLRTEFIDDSGSEKDDTESVNIMFRGTPVEKFPSDSSGAFSPPDSAKEPPRASGGWSSWNMASQRVPRTRDSLGAGRESPMERIDEGFSSRNAAPESNEKPTDSWPPGFFQKTPTSGHTTLSSDAYSTINRVLEHYHDPKLASPEVVQDIQQQMLTKSPELARQGGWDTKRVTQLYLQELARGRYNDPKLKKSLPKIMTSSAEAFPSHDHHETDSANHVTDIESDESESAGPEGAHAYELSEGGWSSHRPSLDVEEKEPAMNRASLSLKGDWADASPSIVDWIHPQAADTPHDTPAEERVFEYRPPLPPKDEDVQPKTGTRLAELQGSQTPRLSSDQRPELPQIQSAGEGLGLSIELAQSETSPVVVPPPLPNHSPPPPPNAMQIDQVLTGEVHHKADLRSPPSPSVYPQSSVFPAETTPIRKSEDSSYYLAGSTISGRHTQATSVAPSSETLVQDQRSVLTRDSTDKGRDLPDQRKLTFRKHLIKELLDTEKTFHTDMTVANEIYKGTSGACNGITGDDVKVLFGNVDQVVAFSKEFLDTLKQAASSVYVLSRNRSESQSKRGSRSTSDSAAMEDRTSSGGNIELSDNEKDRKTFIGEAFGQHILRMEKIYGDYLKNHEAANKRLEKLQKEPRVALWLEECRTVADDLTAAWSLDSLLVKPVQRILKYPLLLSQLLDATPENHPDFTALDVANREMTGASRRINDMKKRVDLVDQAIRRKRKDSDVRTGISKAFGRRTEKLRQQVGLSEIVDDPEFNQISERWHHHYLQLQFTIRDVHYYQTQIQSTVDRFNDFAAAVECFIDVGQSNNPEMESKWRKFGIAVREISSTAITEHNNAITKNVTEPMSSLIKIYEHPQKIMAKRNKRATEHARFKVIKERGDKPDKRTIEQSDQFLALNETLKDELPKLYALTAKLAERCLAVFVELQAKWQKVWQEKIRSILDDRQIPRSGADIVSQFSGDFSIIEAQALSLGICNGSLIAESVNFLSPQTTAGESKRPQPLTGRSRTRSLNSEASPMLPQPDFAGKRHSGNFTFSPLMENMPPLFTGAAPIHTQYANQPSTMGRARTASTISSQGGGMNTPESRSFSVSTPGGVGAYPGSTSASRDMRPSSSTARSGDSMNLPRQSTDSPSPGQHQPYTNHTDSNGQRGANGTAERPFSGFFSSAMPMSETSSPWHSRPPSSPPELHATSSQNAAPTVLFVVASLFEFNIDRERKEAGYPYLTYVKGEVFDVIAEKGELWLARNQDDRSLEVGWIWNKHFAKLGT